MASSRSALFAGAVWCAGACSSDDAFEIPPIVWSGEHLDYAPQPHATPVCEGTLTYMDRYLELGGDVLGVDVGRQVYVQGSAEDPPPCDRADASGCFHEGAVIYSRYAPHEHELVHAARSQLGVLGGALPFFEEGAAEMFGGDDDRRPEPASGDIYEWLAVGAAEMSLGWYTRAGLFSAYLHRHHGPWVTRALLEETSQSTTVDEAVAVLEGLTDQSLDELVADFEQQEPRACSHPRFYRYPLYPCDAPEALRPRCDGARAVPIAVSLACGDEEAIGPREGELFGYVTFDVPADGEYRVLAEPREGGEKAWIEIKECALGCSSHHSSLPYAYPLPGSGHGSLDHEVFLRAGRYSLRFVRLDEPDAATSLAVRITGDDCW